MIIVIWGFFEERQGELKKTHQELVIYRLYVPRQSKVDTFPPLELRDGMVLDNLTPADVYFGWKRERRQCGSLSSVKR